MKTLPAFMVALLATILGTVAAEKTKVTLAIVDIANGKTMPGRIHLKDAAGNPVTAPGLPNWRDHFVCGGEAELELAPGKYRYEVERGPEFGQGRGEFEATAGRMMKVTVALKRLVNMSSEGWWSGELHIHRAANEAELHLRAEDLHMGQFITWWRNRQGTKTLEVPPGNPRHQVDGDRFYHLLAGEDERDGGALLFFNLERPLDFTGAGPQAPSSVVYARAARKDPGAWVDMEKPFWWDFPLWVASGRCDSVGLANNHLHRSGVMDSEAWGKARDKERLPGPKGNGLWSHEIYFHLLNCGLRTPPSAGSASGVLPNPVGYNRVYVQVDGPLTYEKWWAGLRAGRSFVSNGPLLRCRANGELPGHVFKAKGSLTLELEMALTSREPIAALEVIRDGQVVETLAAPGGEQRPKMKPLVFQESGWFLVRAVTTEPKTMRFAMTAPFYVEAGDGKPRISRASAQFFAEWVDEGVKRITLPEGEERKAVLQEHQQAATYWRGILGGANRP